MGESTFRGTQLLSATPLLYSVLPILLFLLGNYQERALYKECISLTVLVMLSLMFSQFCSFQANMLASYPVRVSTLVKYHKFIGYGCGLVLCLHPFLVVLPRYFEGGLSFQDALCTAITTFGSKGIVLGEISWMALLLLLATSFFRKKIRLRHRHWRKIHIVLSILFLATAFLHAMELGRHIDTAMFTLYLFFGGIGMLLLLPYSTRSISLAN